MYACKSRKQLFYRKGVMWLHIVCATCLLSSCQDIVTIVAYQYMEFRLIPTDARIPLHGM